MIDYPTEVLKWWETNKGKTFKRPKGRKTYTVKTDTPPEQHHPSYGLLIACNALPANPYGGNEPRLPFKIIREMIEC
jgi:hypothetical protein